jgi:hypothetical protein
MNNQLDAILKQWLRAVADSWEIPVEQVVISIAAGEIYNRLQRYPEVNNVLSNSSWSIQQFSEVARKCWALGGQFDSIRFRRFVDKESRAILTIQDLISDFPATDRDAAIRIDDFVTEAVALGYAKPDGSRDWAGAAQLASVILTALYPKRFVDFRQTRWHEFAKAFEYDYSPPGGKGYGSKLIWAGSFAKELTETETFQQYWPEGEGLWIISGLCWTGKNPPKPEIEPIDIEGFESFPEGAAKRRLHLIRERNQTVVLKAKQLGLKRDPTLKCEVCDFSFLEEYGEIGQGFIEAHHTQPIATLRPGSKTRIEDIALLCANCHRMIHSGSKTLSLDELRAILQK